MHYMLRYLLIGFLIQVLGSQVHSQEPTIKVVIDSYSNTPSLTMPIELGESVVLVCRVAGIASSIPVSYEWSCPNKGCNIGAGQYPNRQANGNTLVINVLSVEDAGSYECAVKNISSDVVLERATYELKISGGTVIYSEDSLLPSRGVVRHHSEFTTASPERLDIGCLSFGSTLWINTRNIPNVVITSDSNRSNLNVDSTELFLGGQFDCYVDLSFSSNVYLFGNRSAELGQPQFSKVSIESGEIQLEWGRVVAAERYILSYRIKDAPASVPPIFLDRYPDILLRGAIEGAELIPGATYELALWAVRTQTDVSFVSSPAQSEITIPESAPSSPRELQILRLLNSSGLELNWLPSVKPNGNVTYSIQYSTDSSFSSSTTEMTVPSASTHFVVTGLERGLQYYFHIRAANSAGSAASQSVSHMFELQIVPTTSSSSPLPVTSEEGTTSSSEVEGESRTMSTTSTSTSSTPVATREPLNVENEGLSSQQIVLYIVVPLCMVLIVGIIIGVIIVIVLVCRSRRSTPEKGISSIVHCTTAFTGNVPRGGRSQSFVANPHARESVYDTLNGIRDNGNINASPTDQNYSEQAIEIDVVGYSSAEDIAGMKIQDSTDSIDTNEHLYKSAEHKPTDEFPYTWKDTTKNIAQSNTQGTSQTENPEDMYSMPDLSKKTRRVKERLPHERPKPSETESSSDKDKVEEKYSMWDMNTDRPWSVS